MHRLIMNAENNKKVLDLIHSSIISEGGDGDAIWLSKHTPLSELNKLFDEHFIDECDEVYDAKKEIVEYAENVVKLFAISVVSNRRELLFAFIKDWKEEFKDENWDYLDFMVEHFLGKQ